MIFFLATMALSASSAIQVGGGSAAYAQVGRQSGYDRARQTELAKRAFKAEDGRYLEASVLMNVTANEYVAVFAVSGEGSSLALARVQIDATIKRFEERLKGLSLSGDKDIDFVAQTRIFSYDVTDPSIAKEVLSGFEVKKNIALRYKEKRDLDRIIEAAAAANIFDLVKVDYVVTDTTAIQSKLMEEAAKIIRRRASEVETLFGLPKVQITNVYPAQFGTYFPSELYDSYEAQESENIYSYRPNQLIQRARKPRTFYYHGLDGKDYDLVIGPAMVTPMVQCTVYVRAKY